MILALVGEGGAGPHDVVRMMRQGRIYWAAAESHYYAEPKRLEALGYLRSRKTPGQTQSAFKLSRRWLPLVQNSSLRTKRYSSNL